MLSNIYKDEKDEIERFKTLLKFVRPEAFKDQKNSVETIGYIEALEEKLGRKLTEEELSNIKNEPQDEEDLDIIERIEE